MWDEGGGQHPKEPVRNDGYIHHLGFGDGSMGGYMCQTSKNGTLSEISGSCTSCSSKTISIMQKEWLPGGRPSHLVGRGRVG
jgi:hypothetical protein